MMAFHLEHYPVAILDISAVYCPNYSWVRWSLIIVETIVCICSFENRTFSQQAADPNSKFSKPKAPFWTKWIWRCIIWIFNCSHYSARSGVCWKLWNRSKKNSDESEFRCEFGSIWGFYKRSELLIGGFYKVCSTDYFGLNGFAPSRAL